MKEGTLSGERRAQLRQMIGALAPEPSEPPAADASLVADLGYNSLALAELAIAISDEFGIDSTEAEDLEPFLEVQTVADIEQLLAHHLVPTTGI